MTPQDECCGIKLYRFQPCFEPDGSMRGRKISPDSLWFSTPKNLNDPMDIDHPIDDLMRQHNGDSPVLRKMSQVMYSDGQGLFPKNFINEDLLIKIRRWAEHGDHSLDICDEFRARILRLGVACFTPNWDNPPMWAHYGENWRGFAIEYCVHQRDIAIAPKNDAFWQFWVDYGSRIGQTSLSELLFSPYEAVSRILSTKTLPWSYEKEWRLIHLSGGDCLVARPVGIQMTGIVLGPKSPWEQNKLFAEKCAEWNLPLRRVNVGLDKNLRMFEERGLSINIQY